MKKIQISWQVSTQNYYEFDINASKLIFVSKPFIKTMKTLHVTNLSNVDATMEMSFLNDFSGLYSIVPYIGDEPIIIPEGVRYTFRILFGGDQRFYGTYDTAIHILFTVPETQFQKIISLMGLIGDQNIINAYKRKTFIVQ